MRKQHDGSSKRFYRCLTLGDVSSEFASREKQEVIETSEFVCLATALNVRGSMFGIDRDKQAMSHSEIHNPIRVSAKRVELNMSAGYRSAGGSPHSTCRASAPTPCRANKRSTWPGELLVSISAP